MITRQFGIPVTSPRRNFAARKRSRHPPRIGDRGATQHGGFVSDEIIIELIEDWLRLHGGHGFVFDGFPRTSRRRKACSRSSRRHRTPLDLAIWLDVSEQTVNDRISSRLQCGNPAASQPGGGREVFAERPICPYCDGPLVRRTDDETTVLQKRARRNLIPRRNRWLVIMKRGGALQRSMVTAVARRSSRNLALNRASS